MERMFTLREARDVLVEIRPEVAALIDVRAELATKAHLHNCGTDVSIPEIKALEAQMGELLDGLRARGLQVKGYAPLLLDLPANVGDEVVDLCWLEGEDELGWFHDPEVGFMGRRRLADLSIEGATGG